jgi:hypothetical protein
MSRLEDYRDLLVTSCQGITSGNGFRTDVKNVSTAFLDINSLSVFPQISVLVTEERLNSINSTKTIWNSEVDTMLLGYCKSPEMEALAADLKAIMVTLAPENVNDASNRWIIKTNDVGAVTVYRDFVPNSDKGWVGIKFTARIMYQTNTL